MSDNPCLRTACLDDLPKIWCKRANGDWVEHRRWIALQRLFDHEARLRRNR